MKYRFKKKEQNLKTDFVQTLSRRKKTETRTVKSDLFNCRSPNADG